VVELSKASGLTGEYDDLPTGAVCTVTETGTGGADDSVIQPGEVTIGDGTTVDVIATNTSTRCPRTTATRTTDPAAISPAPVGRAPSSWASARSC
jgi:Domain of unknown function (DUF5979)